MRIVRTALVVAMVALGCSSESDESAAVSEVPAVVTDQASPTATAQPTAATEAGAADPTALPTPQASPTPDAVVDPEPGALRRLRVEIVGERPHDPGAFTQGLVLDGEVLYESTGRDTRVRRLDPQTGDVIEQVDVVDDYFGEGLALADGRLVQLTWKSGVAFVYDAATLAEVDQFTYEGEGWGLCLLDDGRFAMSDGTSRLTFRDPATFDAVGSVDVTVGGEPVPLLNELECVGDTVWANVWKTNAIVGIDKATGAVMAVVDASLLDELDPADDSSRVLNGIAYDPTARTFLLTGKEWSTLFEVRFVDAG